MVGGLVVENQVVDLVVDLVEDLVVKAKKSQKITPKPQQQKIRARKKSILLRKKTY